MTPQDRPPADGDDLPEWARQASAVWRALPAGLKLLIVLTALALFAGMLLDAAT